MTFSIVARDPDSGQLGVATATHAYGAGIVANHAQAGVGAVTTQAFIEVGYGPKGLERLAAGSDPEPALAGLVADDPSSDIRQVAVVDTKGRVAVHTGSRCVPSCGSEVGDSVVAVGNMLDNDGVLPAMLEAFSSGDGDLADRLIAALEGGDQAGGDARGRMSASLRVVDSKLARHPWEGTIRDLRSDFSSTPIQDLRVQLSASRAYDAIFAYVFAPGEVTGEHARTGEALDAALAALEASQGALDGDPELSVWQGVLQLRAGQGREGARRIISAIGMRPELARFVDGLAHVGIIGTDSQSLHDLAGKP